MKERALYWIPRIFTILALAFMLMFSFDSFDGDQPVAQKLTGFLMHSIPVLILTVILIVAWIWELWGGILFIAGFIAASVFFDSFTGNPASLVVIGPFMVTGLLFILHWVLYKRSTK